MSDIAVRVEGLGKKYRLGHTVDLQRTFRETLTGLPSDIARKLTAPFRKKTAPQATQSADATGHSHHSYPVEEDFWALRDVSFEIKHGETVGIIGRNGAGKSTLLKVLSRVVTPTTGRAEMRGRLASLLEVGTGFHPELTGRENIYLNGAILGMKKVEIDRKFDEIVDFAEVEQFLDTPVKRYSSGMYVRLAFGVAAHLDPEIMIVDEVLAVGDAQFQKKCLNKMHTVAEGGRTVLFVSHNMTAVQSLCNKGIMLKNGKIHKIGESEEVVRDYLENAEGGETLQKEWPDIQTAPGNEKMRMRSARIRLVDATVPGLLQNSTTFDIEFEFVNLVEGQVLNLSLFLQNEEGILLFNTVPMFEKEWNGKPFPKGVFRSSVRVPGGLLNDGTIHVHMLAVRDQSALLFRIDDILSFEVKDDPKGRTNWFGHFPGAVRPILDWKTELLEPTA